MTPEERLIKMAQLVNLANTPHSDPFETALRADDPPEDTPEDIAEYEADEDARDTERYWLDKAMDAYDARLEEGLDDWKGNGDR